MEDNYTKCYWCNSRAKLIYKKFPSPKTNLYQCEKCKIMFQYPLPTNEEIKNLYNDKYFESWGEDKLIEKGKKKDFRFYLHILEKYNTISEKKLLDIGAAQGFLLEIAKEKGWDIKGIEMSPSIKAKNKEIAEKIIYGDFLDTSLKDDEFSAITSISLFEHIREPKLFVKKIKRILKSNGLWLLLVPNERSLTKKILRKKWPHFNPQHLFYYNLKFFKNLAKEQKFKIVYTKIPYSNYTLFYLLNQTRVNSKGFLSFIAKLLLRTIPSPLLKIKIKISGSNLLILMRNLS